METIDQIVLNFNKGNLAGINTAIALVMFSVALEIRLSDFKEVFRNPKMILTGVVSQFLLLPLLTVILIRLLPLHPSFALGMILVAVCPGGNVSNFFTLLAKGNAALSICLTSISTLAAGFVIPLAFHFWSRFSPITAALLDEVAVDFWELFLLAFLLLGLPLFIGMTLAHFLPKFSRKLSKPLKTLSILFFMALILGAFLANWETFIQLFHAIFWLVLLHNGIALLVGYGFAKAMGLAEREQRTISLETGLQNAGLALVLVFNFFPNLGGMMIVVAWWGIWHMVAGLLLGFFFGRKVTN